MSEPSDHRLNIKSPSVCADKTKPGHGLGRFSCAGCEHNTAATPGGDLAGCTLRRQGPYLYGWSDSNVQYEFLGHAK